MSDATMRQDALAEFEEAVGHAISLGATRVELEELLRGIEAQDDA